MLAPVLVFAVSIFAFSPALQAGFVWDDQLVITGNYEFRGLGSDNLTWMATTSRAGHYQPLTWLSLALDFERGGLVPPEAPDARGFHQTNLLLHGLFAVALYFLALELLPLAAGPGRPARRTPALLVAAAAAALLHAVHPLRCESVCWVTERRDVLSGLLFALALVAYVRGATPGTRPTWRVAWLVGSGAGAAAALGCFFASVSLSAPEALATGPLGMLGLLLAGALLLGSIVASSIAIGSTEERERLIWRSLCPLLVWLSLLAKGWAMVIPVLLLVLDVYPLRRVQGLGRGTLRELGLLVLEKAPLIALSIVFARLASWAQVAQQGALDTWQAHTLTDRMAQAAYGILFYPAKTLLPVGLIPARHIPEDFGLAEPRFLAALLTVVLVSVLLVAVVRRNPAFLAAWLGYIVIVSPVLGLAQAGSQLVADRYSYLSCVPFALLAGGLLMSWAGGSLRRLACGAAAASVLVAVLVLLSHAQSRVWQSDAALWEYAYVSGSRSSSTVLNYGVIRMAQAQAATSASERLALFEEADRVLRRGSELFPQSELFLLNRAVLGLKRARYAQDDERAQQLRQAAELAERAIALGEAKGLRDVQLHLQYGSILRSQGRADLSVRQFERALVLAPGLPEAQVGLGGSLIARAQSTVEDDPERALTDLRRAVAQIERAREIEPRSQDARFLLGVGLDLQSRLLDYLGQGTEARAARVRAIAAYDSVLPSDPAASVARASVEALRSLEAGESQ